MGADTQSSYCDSEHDSVDGSSPAVIAQVSELLNYVYGNTSVTGQIERVSTIMQSYEGRESVLLELLETKALMKADNKNGNRADLPDSLRSQPVLKVKDSMISQNQSGEFELVSQGSNIISPTISREIEKFHTFDNAIGKPLQNATVQPTTEPQVNFPSSNLRNNNSSKKVQKNKQYKVEPIKFNNAKKNVKHSCASDALTNTNYLDKKKKKKRDFWCNIWRKNKKKKKKKS